MNLYLRLLRVLFKTLWVRRRPALEAAVLRFRVWPTDCDLNLHLNNGRYLTFMDLGRVYLMAQAGMMGEIIRRRWAPVLGAAEINFIRPLNPFQAFDLSTRLLTWDDKYFYVEQRFEVGGRLHAVAMVKGLLMHGRARIPTGEALRLAGVDSEPPAMSGVLRHWNDLGALKKQHLS